MHIYTRTILFRWKCYQPLMLIKQAKTSTIMFFQHPLITIKAKQCCLLCFNLSRANCVEDLHQLKMLLQKYRLWIFWHLDIQILVKLQHHPQKCPLNYQTQDVQTTMKHGLAFIKFGNMWLHASSIPSKKRKNRCVTEKKFNATSRSIERIFKEDT